MPPETSANSEPSSLYLPGRAESMRVLDERLSQMQLNTVTDVKGVAKVWQPPEFLPDFRNLEKATADVRKIQEAARSLPPEVIAVLVGDTVTEDGLPLFMSALYGADGLPEGDASNPGKDSALRNWIHRWTAEENRHGEVLNGWLNVSGRVDMDAYYRTVQLFLEDGMDLGSGNDPYKIFYYTSFQELATLYSHRNVARIARDHHDKLIAQISATVAGDEGRHARAYSQFVQVFLEHDPDGMTEAVAHMMKHGINMPAHNMREVQKVTGAILEPGSTFEAFSDTAQNLGVYTTKHYAEISGRLLTEWKLAQRETGGKWVPGEIDTLSEKGKDAQAMILRIQNLLQRKADNHKPPNLPQHDFSWIS